MGRIYKYLGNKESARELWENREALDKYLAALKRLMMADPNCLMTEYETKDQAAERARLYNLEHPV